MATKFYSGAPFGTQTARFDVAGVHPANKIPGTFTQTPYCRKSTTELVRKLAPGTYDVELQGSDFTAGVLAQKAATPGWQRSYDTMKMAQIPHLLYREQWLKNKELKRRLGPGMYENHLLDSLRDSNTKPASERGICDTRDERFRSYVRNTNPGPGTYGEGGIPNTAQDKRAAMSASNVGLLDSGAPTDRSLPLVGSHLAPGRYERKSFTEELGARLVSKKGPYDLFSGERSDPNKTGHLAREILPLGPGEYDLPSGLDVWKTKHKKKHGQFGKVKQFPNPKPERVYNSTLAQCPRRPTTPCANTYQMSGEYDVTPNSAPFLTSAERFNRRANKNFTGNANPCGVGRYQINRWHNSQHRYGGKHVFQSSKERFRSPPRDKYMKERVREKAVLVKDRTFITGPRSAPTGAVIAA